MCLPFTGFLLRSSKSQPGPDPRRYRHSRRLISAICCTLLVGCTSLQTLDMPAEDLHTSLRSGDISLVGERVRIVTADGTEHKFRVTSVDDVAIHSSKGSFNIDDVVAVQTSKISAGKTTLLAGGLIGAWVLVAVLIAPAAILAAAAP